MKAILWTNGATVVRYRMEDGSKEGGERTATGRPDPLGEDLSAWFSRGWKFHTGLPSTENAMTVIVLRK